MHSSSYNIKFTSYSEVNDVIKKLFKSLRSKHQDGFETSMKGSDFIFDSVQLIYYQKCSEVNFKHGDSYIDSPCWRKKKKATINAKNEDDKYFQHAATAASNPEEIKQNSERVSNIKPFINECNCKGINYPSKIDDWKTFEKNNPTIALNILYINEKEIFPVYVSKHNSTGEKHIILLMIPNEEKEGWHYLAVKKHSALLRGITSKHHDYLYCLNCLHSFTTENKLKSPEKICKNKDFCGIVMPSEKDKILEFNQHIKSDKMSCIIYADIESLIKKIDRCANNLEKSSTTKIGKHIPCGYSMSTIWALIVQKINILYIVEKIV